MTTLRSESGAIIEPGSTVKDFRDEERTFDPISRPAAGNSTGRVQLSRPCGHNESDHKTSTYWCTGTEVREFYPSVIEAQIEA
ncbi:hypothetical protein ACWDG9_16955 [Streptomyces sp. NPDC001073]